MIDQNASQSVNQPPLNACPEVVAHQLEGDGKIPNNPILPLFVYLGVASGDSEAIASLFETTVDTNHWRASWRWGVYNYHHFHSNAHEALGCYRGSATILFGGENGVVVNVKAGDFVVIPAGVGHKLLNSSGSFSVVGSYPVGQSHDMRYGDEKEYDAAVKRVAETALPESDPLYGDHGPLAEYWSLPLKS